MSVDLELKKAFTELQVKMIETSKKISVIDTQIEVLDSILKHSKLMQEEIDKLPPETRTFDPVGRMFLLTTLNEVKNNLKSKIYVLENQTYDLSNNKEYLERNLKESEDNIREMVQQRREQSDMRSE